jgi:hypothetical protein
VALLIKQRALRAPRRKIMRLPRTRRPPVPPPRHSHCQTRRRQGSDRAGAQWRAGTGKRRRRRYRRSCRPQSGRVGDSVQTANVLNKLPKSQHSRAKRALQEIWMAATKEGLLVAFNAFVETWGVKLPPETASRPEQPLGLPPKTATRDCHRWDCHRWSSILMTRRTYFSMSRASLRSLTSRPKRDCHPFCGIAPAAVELGKEALPTLSR